MIDREQIQVEVSRSDLIYINRCLDSVYPVIEAVSAEGDEDESLMIELEEVRALVKEYLNKKDNNEQG